MRKQRVSNYQFSVLLVVVLFLFNYLSSQIIDAIQSYQPSAYSIATGSVGKLLTYISHNWLTYGITLIGYFFVWMMLIMVVVTTMLLTWGISRKENFLTGLKSLQIHLAVFVMMLLLIPLNQVGFKFPIAYYLTIPKTFIDPIKTPIVWIVVGFVNICLLLVAYRLRLMPYFAITTRGSLKANMIHSWRQTKFQTGQFLLTIGKYALITIIVVGGLFWLQRLFDQGRHDGLNRSMANILIAIAIGYFYVVTSQVFLLFVIKDQQTARIRLRDRKLYLIITQVVIIVLVGAVSSSLSGKFVSQPIKNYVVIAHKGVSSESDASNTIISLNKVSKTKPDYVEIDIQATSDGVYVLSHNAKIKAKNGKTYQINETPWHVLKNVRYEENGKIITATPFLTYIKRANQLNQKLLVELKINTTITTAQLVNFQKKYGQYLTENRAQLQSMNQNAIKRLAKYSDRPIGLLSPVVNSVNRAKFNTFYAMEYSNVNTNIARQVTKDHKKLYVWTLNTEADINSNYALGVQGYITDYPKETRALLQKLSRHAVYADAIWYIVMLQKTAI
ncbi:glycerophosphodiester phosphodiesterase family protein [Leuconostoc sp. MS02]|uniref:Glycerophosphodiester phosphodiesterase family protein n=1 Tax=Leuconostoc aquikimchii TaxID=3236804 RepID=A0ABV3S5A2_9LACO